MPKKPYRHMAQFGHDKELRWRKLSKEYLKHNPFCRMCKQVGLYEWARVVDHIVPLNKDPSLAFDIDNLQGLCLYHHNSTKKREEIRGREMGCDINGVPKQPHGDWNR